MAADDEFGAVVADVEEGVVDLVDLGAGHPEDPPDPLGLQAFDDALGAADGGGLGGAHAIASRV